MTLTYTQIRVLNWLREFQALKGFMPTVAEIKGHFGWASNNAADTHIEALVRRGAITKQPGTARSIRFTAEGSALVGASTPRDLAPTLMALPVLEMRQVAGFSKNLRRIGVSA